MTCLTIHPDHDASATRFASRDATRIGAELDRRGIRFERPGAGRALADTQAATILAAYADLTAQQRDRHGYTSIDAVSVSASTPDLPMLRSKFLSEHTHDEDEARFMVDGAGTFYLRTEGEVLILELTAGDLISVPQGMRHWFDMGERPRFTAIRFFTRPDGWVGRFTGDAIAERFPLYSGPA